MLEAARLQFFLAKQGIGKLVAGIGLSLSDPERRCIDRMAQKP